MEIFFYQLSKDKVNAMGGMELASQFYFKFQEAQALTISLSYIRRRTERARACQIDFKFGQRHGGAAGNAPYVNPNLS